MRSVVFLKSLLYLVLITICLCENSKTSRTILSYLNASADSTFPLIVKASAKENNETIKKECKNSKTSRTTFTYFNARGESIPPLIVKASAEEANETIKEPCKNSKTSRTTLSYLNTSAESIFPLIVKASAEEDNETITEAFNCTSAYDIFRHKWFRGVIQLTSLLHEMQVRNCSEFALECKQRNFAFNGYSQLVYDRFCDSKLFDDKCKKGNGTRLSDLNYTDSINSLRMRNFCEQVLMYEPESEHQYIEFVTKYSPFCGVSWCGYRLDVAQDLHMTEWTCLPAECRRNVIIVMSIAGVLAIFTVIVNVLVITVITSYPNSKSRQLVYKLCLAASDMVTGVLVLPLFVLTVYMKFIANTNLPHDDGFGLKESNASNMPVIYNLSTLHKTTEFYKVDESLETGEYFPPGYLAVFGIFSCWSLMATLYTLLCASFDQLRCIWKPFSITIDRALLIAKILSLVVWVISFVIALLPAFVQGLAPYHLVTGLPIAHGDYALLLYGVTFLVPLLLLWAINLFTWLVLRKKEKSAFGRCDDSRIQRKLIKTLTTMIGVFTLCILPFGFGIVILQIEVKLHKKATDMVPPTTTIESFDLVATLLLLSKGIWNGFIYNTRSQGFREMTSEKFHYCYASCCLFGCGRRVQSASRKVRRRVRSLSKANIHNL